MRGDEHLEVVLEDARQHGFLGPGPVAEHLAHADALAAAIGEHTSEFLDLGSGAGVPGLVLALRWPLAHGLLLDASTRRCRFLEGAINLLDLGNRVGVECGRAELLARSPTLRGRFPLVVARAFAAPAVVAECGSGFLAARGRLVVTEPPDRGAARRERWPTDGLAVLGLVVTGWIGTGEVGAVVLEAAEPVPERYPRRVGVPAKRPLW